MTVIFKDGTEITIVRYSSFALRLYGLDAFSVYETVNFLSLKFTPKYGAINYLFSETSSRIEVD